MYFNEQFDLSALEMNRLGVFNPLMGPDNELFVDPKLLDNAPGEFRDSRLELKNYFAGTVYLIQTSKQKGDIWWTQARDRTISREKASAGIGYSKNGKSGRGIGKVLAGRIVDRAAEILPHVAYKPDIFELMGIFAKGLGCDRLSDMIVSILSERFYAYTARMAQELGIHQLKPIVGTQKEYLCPCFSEEQGPILLLPKSLLKALPIAANIGEALEIADLNEDVRSQLNALAAAAATKGRSPSKADLQMFIFSRPAIYNDIVTGYEAATSQPYDFDQDPHRIGDSAAIAREIVGKPVVQVVDQSPSARVEALLAAMLASLKKLMQENKLSDLLFNDDGSPRREVMTQRLIFAIAGIYAPLYNVDINREPNAGNGPVDFKFSVGHESRVLIEVKLSSHPRISEAYYYQLPAYAKSEGITRLVLLVVQVDEKTAQIDKLRDAIKANDENTIQLEVIDARKRESASKRSS